MNKSVRPSAGTTGKYFSLILGLSIIPALSVCLVLLFFYAQETEERSKELAEQDAFYQSRTVECTLDDLRQNMQILAEIIDNRIMSPGSAEELFKLFSPILPVSGMAVSSPNNMVHSKTGHTPDDSFLVREIFQIDGLHRMNSFTRLWRDQSERWFAVLGIRLAAEPDTLFLMSFIGLNSLLPVKALPGSLTLTWSVLLDNQGSVLAAGGNNHPQPGAYMNQARKSIERQRSVQDVAKVNGSTRHIFMIPVDQNLITLGLAYDLHNFTLGEKTLLQKMMLIMSLLIAALIPVSWFISKKYAYYLNQRETYLQSVNEQVVEAGKMASIGELASGIAHEINNPVAIMAEEAGWMQDLLEEESDLAGAKNFEELTRSLNQIRTQGRRCKEITHKLLSFARKSDSRIQNVDLNALAEEISAISDKRAKYAGVKINLDLDPTVPAVQASATEMQQVFLNIVNNSLDAMEKNGGELSITSRRDQDGLHFLFKDTGDGIPKANLAKIFDPFFTTKPVGKGTGLGLSICYAIIQNLGGNITVTSQTGVGTTFHIHLPAPAEEMNQESKS